MVSDFLAETDKPKEEKETTEEASTKEEAGAKKEEDKSKSETKQGKERYCMYASEMRGMPPGEPGYQCREGEMCVRMGDGISLHRLRPFSPDIFFLVS